MEHWDEHGGFPRTSLRALLRERWGVKDIMDPSAGTLPIAEGKYWPVGLPYRPGTLRETTKRLLSKKEESARGCPAGAFMRNV